MIVALWFQKYSLETHVKDYMKLWRGINFFPKLGHFMT
jgi:hypothetical protein